MFRKSRAILALALVLLLCFGGSISVLANLNSDGALIGSESEPVAAVITKHLRMPVETAMRDFNFEFEAKKLNLDGNSSEEALEDMPDLNNLIIRFSSEDPEGNVPDSITNNIMSFKMESGNIFEDVVFPHPGIFEYEIRELSGTNGILDTNAPHDVLTYSPAVYKLTVFVESREDGSTFVVALGTRVVVQDNASQSPGSKVDPTPGGDGEHYFFGQMVFTNDYVRTNGAVDPENPNPVTESTLYVSKQVAGDFANADQYFDFSMTLTIPSLVIDPPTYYRAYIVEDGRVIDPSNNADETLIGSDAEGGLQYIRISTSGATAFSLRDGQRLVFVNTPVGTSYEVTEAGAVNYTASVRVTTSGVAVELPRGEMSESLSTGTQFVGELANSAAFTNTRDSVTPTGLNLNNLPFIGLIALAIGTLITFIVVKSRKSRQYDQ